MSTMKAEYINNWRQRDKERCGFFKNPIQHASEGQEKWKADTELDIPTKEQYTDPVSPMPPVSVK